MAVLNLTVANTDVSNVQMTDPLELTITITAIANMPQPPIQSSVIALSMFASNVLIPLQPQLLRAPPTRVFARIISATNVSQTAIVPVATNV
jgi:hypothetical protein